MNAQAVIYKAQRSLLAVVQCQKTVSNIRNEVLFVTGRPGQLSLIFAGQAWACPSEAPLRCFTLEQAPGLAHKCSARLEKPARDKET